MPVPFEINKARSVLRVNKAWPSVDVLTILQKYADVEFTDIPVNADAVCLNLRKPGIKPTVILNKDRPLKRRRFTMAHELGHILIPWHRGSIVDDTSVLPSHTSTYSEMEFEANRFASELLMPEEWILPLVTRISSLSELAVFISSNADVSLPAAVLRMRNSLPKGFVFAELDSDHTVINSWRSPGTIANEPNVGTQIDPIAEFIIAEDRWNLQTSYSVYWWWKLPTAMEIPVSREVDWRKVLSDILNSYPVDEAQRKKAYASVSATAANANSTSGSSTEEIYAAIVQRFFSKAKNDPLFSHIMSHPNIRLYMASRALAFNGAAPRR